MDKNSRRYYFLNYTEPIIQSMEQKCSMCGSTIRLLAHHIDENYKNNGLSNIAILCRGCHNKVHVRNPKGRKNIGIENRPLHIGNRYRRGKKASETTKRKMTEAHKKRWAKRKQNGGDLVGQEHNEKQGRHFQSG